jgi:hypothetical protein
MEESKMAKSIPGKFEVDVTALNLGANDLAALDKAIQKAVLAQLVTIESNPAALRVFGRPGRTAGIQIQMSDLKQFQ